MPYCSSCGTAAEASARFCTNCGAPRNSQPAAAAVAADAKRYDFSTPLLELSGAGDVFTLDDATMGVLIMGGTGSGKTSASGRSLALSYLVEGFGFLVLCAKPDEVKLWRDYAFLADREADLAVIEPDGAHHFNFLEYERTRVGDSPAQLAIVLTEAADQLANTAGTRAAEGEAFWTNELTKLAENTLQTAMMAGKPVQMVTLADIVRSAPLDAQQFHDEEWQAGSLCAQCLIEAAAAIDPADTEALRDWENLQNYWAQEWAVLDEKTRGPIRSSFTTLSRVFDRRPLRRLLASDTTLTPTDVFDGRIVVVGLDTATHGVDGRVCNFMWKQAFQRAVLARVNKDRPVCLWADEAQNFIDVKDPDYQSQCRSALACTVYLGHSPAMFGKMIPGGNSDKAVEAFLGNLQTKILHQNACKFFSSLFGRRLVKETSTQHGRGERGDAHSGTATGQVERDVLPAIKFTELRTGGSANDYIVEAYVRSANSPRFKATGENYLKIAIPQEQYMPEGWMPAAEINRHS